MTRISRLALLASSLVALSLTLSSCYYQDALNAKNANGPVPWWCTSTEEIPVTTGPAVGTVDWYAGTHKSPLPWDDCVAMSGMFDVAKPTRSNGRPRARPRATAGTR